MLVKDEYRSSTIASADALRKKLSASRPLQTASELRMSHPIQCSRAAGVENYVWTLSKYDYIMALSLFMIGLSIILLRSSFSLMNMASYAPPTFPVKLTCGVKSVTPM